MATIQWSQGISGQFTNAAGWNPKRVPTASDDVAIVAAGTYTVTVSANITIRSLTMIKTATLAVNGGNALTNTSDTLAITNGGASAGTISVADRDFLEIGGTFDNTGNILLNSAGHDTGLIVAGTTLLSGKGVVELSDNSHNGIVGVPPANRFTPPSARLTVTNTIEGAGTIGTNLTLNNEGRIIGDGTTAALFINTGTSNIGNSGAIEGTTAEGVTVVSNVLNSGIVGAVGTSANLTIDGTVTNTAPTSTSKGGLVETAGLGAHIGLSSAAITGGVLQIGGGGIVEALADTGASSLANLAINGSGTLQANEFTTLDITNSTISPAVALVANGLGSDVIVTGPTGAVASTIDGGKIEFNGASAANVTFTPGSVGTLKLDSTFTGTVSGLAAAVPTSFSDLFVFGDSTVDAGALRFLSPLIGDADLTARLQSAFANGGTDSPVGVGQMNSQYLAEMFGLSANTAYTTGGVVGGGGTNYAISGALDAADPGHASTGDLGNRGLTNTFQQDTGAGSINPAVLSTVAQIQTYLGSTHGVADSSALYFISSGANDASFAKNTFKSGPLSVQLAEIDAYLTAQAQTLATEIGALYDAGARHILVNDVMNGKAESLEYSSLLYGDLDSSGILYTRTDGREMLQHVIANPVQYGFNSSTASTAFPALVDANPDGNISGNTGGFSAFGLWGANTTIPDSTAVPAADRYSSLDPSTPDPEQSSLFSDSIGHLSNAGQQIQAAYNYSLLTDDAIDLTNLAYDPRNLVLSYTGNATGGTLTLSNETQSATIALLGDYTHAVFVTASDGIFIDPIQGTTGTLVMDTGNSPQSLVAAGH